MREAMWFIGAGTLTVIAVVFGLQSPTVFSVLAAAAVAVIGYLTVPSRLVLGISVSIAIVATALVPGLTQNSGPAQFAAAATSGALVCVSFGRVRRPPKASAFVSLIVIFYGLAIAVTIVNPLANWFYVSTVLVALPVAFASRALAEEERRIVNWVIIGLGIVLSLIGIVETFVVQRLIFSEPTVGVSASAFFDLVRAQATTGSALILGFLLCIALLLAVSIDGRRFSKLVVCIVLLTGIIATGSASIFAVVVIGILLVVFIRSRPGSRALLIVFGGAGVILAANAGWFPAEFTAQFSGINIEQRANSLASVPRIITHQDVAHAFFGNGWGGADLLYNSGVLIESSSRSVDNQIVTTLIETGIFGILLLAAAVFVALRKARTEYRVAIVGVVLLFASFDVLLWALPATLLLFLASSPALLNRPTSEGAKAAENAVLQAQGRFDREGPNTLVNSGIIGH